ncbi:hypothetical protein [Streptomyces sp. NPDC047985]
MAKQLRAVAKPDDVDYPPSMTKNSRFDASGGEPAVRSADPAMRSTM